MGETTNLLAFQIYNACRQAHSPQEILKAAYTRASTTVASPQDVLVRMKWLAQRGYDPIDDYGMNRAR